MTARGGVYCAILAIVAFGCGQGIAPPSPETATPAVGRTDGAVSMSGINLFLHDARPTAGAARKPTFWVHAEYFTMLDDQVWSFENAQAAIYGRTPEEKQITLEAARGRFQEDSGALLDGGVTAYVGEMTLDLADIEWINPRQEGEEGIARSDSPLRVSSNKLQLRASSLRLYPESDKFVLTNVSGLVRFGDHAP